MCLQHYVRCKVRSHSRCRHVRCISTTSHVSAISFHSFSWFVYCYPPFNLQNVWRFQYFFYILRHAWIDIISIIYIFIMPVVCDWVSMITLSEYVTTEVAGLRWFLNREWGTNPDFHDKYLVTRDMAGSDLVYITRCEHNIAGIFGICIVDTSQIVMQFKQFLSHVDVVVVVVV